MRYQYITPDLFEFCENSKTKIARKIYENVLNYDMIAVLSDGHTWYIEKTNSDAQIPKYAYTWLEKHYKKRGLTYLWKH